jgi:hypothetical protein
MAIYILLYIPGFFHTYLGHHAQQLDARMSKTLCCPSWWRLMLRLTCERHRACCAMCEFKKHGFYILLGHVFALNEALGVA